MKARVARVTLRRVGEADASRCDTLFFHGADAIASAEAVLLEMAFAAPSIGKGYLKVDFAVLWANGMDYSGRFDLVSGGSNDAGQTLRQQIVDFLEFSLGLKRPPNLREEDYEAIRAKDPDMALKSFDMLNECEI